MKLPNGAIADIPMYVKKVQLLDTVALLKPISADRLTLVKPEFAFVSTLPIGLVGTVVEVYNEGEDSKYLVEFSDNQGCEYAMVTLMSNKIIVLQYELAGIQT